MDPIFYKAHEVAAILRVKLKTLQNRVSSHEVYRPCQPGIYHRVQVEVIVRVWAGALTPEEGLALWTLEKRRLRLDARKASQD